MLSIRAWVLVAAAVLLAVATGAHAGDRETIALPVPKVTIYPGDSIGAELIVQRLFVARTVTRSSVLGSGTLVIGKVARRTLLPGQPIPVNALREAHVIAQGKPALLVYKDDGLTITSTALALENGGVGDLVSARNADSGIIVKGIVQPDATILVDAR